MKRILLISLILVPALLTRSFAQQEARLLRFPTVSADQVVFSYAGDLYTVSLQGGLARKLTSHEGQEIFPRFSPDGKRIAFTGQYDGNTEIYTIPAEGGTPARLTTTATLNRDDISDRMGPNNILMAWTPDGKNVVYRSRKKSFNDFVGQLFSVPETGGMSTQLPLPAGGFCSYAPDGKKLAYNRVFREFRTWKYYRGGMADDIWIYDFATKKTENITSSKAQDIIPMWYQNEIYFLSDRDRTMNLFAYDLKTKATRKVTHFTEYDIKFPSLGKDAIAFENAGYIYIFDLKTQKERKLDIRIADDFLAGRDEWKDATKNIQSTDVSPDGERLVFSARGDVFSVPAKKGITRNLTHSAGAHDRDVAWSPDGQWIAWISDQTGEFEIFIQKQDGSEPPKQITSGADTYKYRILWSPDSKKIAWADKMLRLQFVDVDSKKVTLVEKSGIGELTDFDWSPDSRWMVFSRIKNSDFSVVSLYNLDSQKVTEVSDTWYDSGSGVFSRDGKYLAFVSNRDFNPIYSQTEWNHAYRDMSRIYLVTLQKSQASPFAPENVEVAVQPVENKESGPEKKDKGKKDEPKKEGDGTSPVEVVIDLDGIGSRIIDLPVEAANYYNLAFAGDKIYYNCYSSKTGKGSMKFFDLKEKKETEVGEGLSYSMTAKGKKMLVRKDQNYYVTDLPSGSLSLKDPANLSGLRMWVNNREEWKQIYDEAWRQMRDFFYVPNMHGVDWKKMHDKYAVLLPWVNNRNDLTYLIGELIGELNVGHAYIGGGDRPMPERIKTGLLGAEISPDPSGYFRIDRILPGANWENATRSPLTEVGVDVKEGDLILAVNGNSTKGVADFYSLLIHAANKTVELTVNSKADEKTARKVLVVPTDDESGLYYYNWVQKNIEYVEKKTNGQVGYIHIPDMGVEGLVEFTKYFYPQLSKKALIIDDRGNGGGNVSPMILERLQREMSRANMMRNATVPTQTPRQMMLGPKVALINNYSASDGDLFPYGFRKHGLGKLIGLRTWGGVVGIRGSLPFVDGASLSKPEFASYDANESKWIIEGEGVEPDIVVDNDPALEYQGIDQQLDKAIEVILEELKTWNQAIPPIPPAPDKSK